ncbi:unnamed protein product [Clonostachys byssicola]|uniref:Uncharacterized protein n=1 Tax=Clonostachys byssicola TaxID=160290 RepID=A0A9N9UGN0_9HYPO|nr:unnamed protein product [Clonostachys byssicola]
MLAELSYCCCFSEEAGSGHFITPVEEVPVGGIFCLLDCRPEGPGSVLGLVWLLACSGGGGFFRFLVDDGVVLELFEVSVEMVPSEAVEGTGAPEGRATWLAAWRADDLVILGGMSNELSEATNRHGRRSKAGVVKENETMKGCAMRLHFDA